MALGDNNTDEFPNLTQPATAWVLFIACEVFTNIVMLNLLITIISTSFDEIKNNATYANFKERANIITENNYLEKCFRFLMREKD